MEVVGAVASFIAIGQGLDAGFRVVNFMRDIPEIQQNYEALRKEIEFTTHVLTVCQLVVDQSPDDSGSPLIIEAIEQLKETEVELSKFAASCTRVRKGNDEKAKKHKWMLERNKLEKLRAKALAARKNLQLAYSKEGAQEKLDHLRTAADFDLEARDDNGWTPVLHAIIKSNFPALRCLVEAGASLLVVDNYSRNLLHLAALSCGAEVLHYLASLELSGIDTDLVDIIGNSPWDLLQFAIYAPAWTLGIRLHVSSHD
ncbi:hypothetical protein QQZ08_009151 [Neonectria magnoliae]|uniref:NACHT-NTPase and P-loop NTPases N-terminal domain-containing protein n=1 Tax=Neonectria magnoliae TaxID=2732573 RepID=A0ABR1HPU6_9HYPO